MSIILVLITITFFLWVAPSAILYNRERTMTNYNFWALLFNISKSIERYFRKDWKPKSDIDKEIAEEEKEIAELERQKEEINKFHRLKRRKEELLEQVDRYSE